MMGLLFSARDLDLFQVTKALTFRFKGRHSPLVMSRRRLVTGCLESLICIEENVLCF
jgi:hypothetical protein